MHRSCLSHKYLVVNIVVPLNFFIIFEMIFDLKNDKHSREISHIILLHHLPLILTSY